jgi:hypothetical protein
MHGAVALDREQRDDIPKGLLEEIDAGAGHPVIDTPVLRALLNRKNERDKAPVTL